MFLPNKILGLQNPTDILVLESGVIYVDKDEPPINRFTEGTVNVRTSAEEFVIDSRRRMTLPGETMITVVFRPLEALLPKRFNILATANKGQLVVELIGVLISGIDKVCVLKDLTYKGTTLTCYAEALTCYAEGIGVRRSKSKVD
jgi:hypothetical protein